MELIFATHNTNKADEIKQMLPQGFRLYTLADMGYHDDIDEPYATLQENARAKAKWLNNKSAMPCFADDTGLEVDALGGAPGVKSARYAGEPADNERNIDKLLKALGHSAERGARFRTVIAAVIKNETYFFEGIVEGSITTTRTGSKGFGYDPIFLPAGFNKTFAEMTAEEKNTISHRSKALKAFISFLKTIKP